MGREEESGARDVAAQEVGDDGDGKEHVSSGCGMPVTCGAADIASKLPRLAAQSDGDPDVGDSALQMFSQLRALVVP